MTTPIGVRGIVAPFLAATATAALISGALWVQHVRGAWPFAPTPTASVQTGATAMVIDGDGASPDRVPIDVPAPTLDALGVRTESVQRQSLTEAVRAVATISPDETQISHVHTRVSGWVEQLLVNTTGEVVQAGQPLLRIFSQELLASQTEYLAARRMTTAEGIASAVVAGGRARLAVLGMAPADIDTIEQSGTPFRLVTVVAPRSGVVVNRGVTVGTAVDPSTTLLTIADLSRVWVLAEVPEANIPGIRAGTPAVLEFPASGQAPFTARVEFVYPTLTERTRTLRVRLAVANPRGSLRPGLYGTASFQSIGASVLTVPRDAVVDTGRRQHVFVAIGDRFEPRSITLGVQLADRVEVRAGLAEGDRVVASGVFLLDSESRLRATGGAGGHNHGSMPTPEAAPPPAATSAVPPAANPHAGH
jgi:membrane fusion protein, copper/silver efflux system